MDDRYGFERQCGWQMWEKRLAGVKVGAWLDAKVLWLANLALRGWWLANMVVRDWWLAVMGTERGDATCG